MCFNSVDIEDTRSVLKPVNVNSSYNLLPNSIFSTENPEVDAVLTDSLPYIKRTYPWTVEGLLTEVKKTKTNKCRFQKLSCIR